MPSAQDLQKAEEEKLYEKNVVFNKFTFSISGGFL